MSGIEKIAAERQRQIDVEDWTPDHDDQHDEGELADAAAVYATVTQENVVLRLVDLLRARWPWEPCWFKPFSEPPANDPQYEYSFPVVDRVRCLIKAGALIAAELDRLERLEREGPFEI